MNAILCVALLVGLVWSGVVFLRGGLLGGCLMVLLAGCCFGHAFYRLDLGPVPITLDRILWAALLVQYVVWRRQGLVGGKPLGVAEWVLLAFVAVLALSTFAHDWHVRDHQPLARLAFYYLMPVALYWVARQIPLDDRGARVVLGGLALFALYLAVTALAETREAWWLVYPKYVASTAQTDFLGRARGPLLNPVGSGLLEGVGLCCLLAWWPRTGRAGRLAIVAGAVVVVLGIYCTLTRTAWIGAGVGLAVFLAFVLPRAWRGPATACLVLAAVVVGTTQWERILAFQRDRGVGARASAESVELRPVLAAAAWKMFRDRPLLGHGLAQYDSRKFDYVNDRTSTARLDRARPYTQHNVFLSLLVETGLIGAGLFVILLMLWTRDAWRAWRSDATPPWARSICVLLFVVLGNYLVNGMFHDVSLIPMVNMFLFFVAGIAAGLRLPSATTREATALEDRSPVDAVIVPTDRTECPAPQAVGTPGD